MIPTATDPTADLDQPEVAFAAMSSRLAGLTAAIDGFAARQQEIHARDYSKDLAHIQLRQKAVHDALVELDARPGIALTPADIANQVELAGAKGRAEEHAAWKTAHRELGNAIRSIDGAVASALTAREQKRWVAATAAVAVVIGFVLGAIVPAWIDRAVPASWQWPEQHAARLLDRDSWDAGMHLLQVSDNRQWRLLQDAMRIATDNPDALGDCRARAVRAKKKVNCSIAVRAE